VAINALMRVLRDPAMATQHAKVIDALMTIFKSLSLAAVPYLPKVGVCSACCVWCALTRSCSVSLLDLSCGAVPTYQRWVSAPRVVCGVRSLARARCCCLTYHVVPYLPEVGCCSVCCVWCALTRSCSCCCLPHH